MSHNELHGRLTGRQLSVGLATLALVLSLGTAGAVAAASAGDAPAAGPQGSSDSGDATVRAALDAAPDGLAGFKLQLSVDAGTVTSASYPDFYRPTTDPVVSADGQSVTIEAADLQDEVTDGATDVVLATVAVDDLDGQQPAVSVADAQLDADGGDRIDPESVRLAVDRPTVGQDESPAVGGGADGSAAPGGAGEDEVTDDGDSPAANGPRPIGVAAVGVAFALLALVALVRRAGRE